MNATERGALRRERIIRKVTDHRMSTLSRLRGYDSLRNRKDCEFCGGNGHAAGNVNDPNECGFCD